MLNRRDTILKCIVEYFIKKAEPLGSQTLIEEYHLPYSSATIRNEMLELEKMGYIEKTHTSSGRVPSTKGYRYYCENLRDNSVSEELKHSLQTVLEGKLQSVEEVIKESCEILSHMTNLVSVVMGPDEKSERLASIQMIKISSNSLTAIFVTDKGYVENKTFIVPDNISADEIVDCVKILNERLVGTPVNELVDKVEVLKPVISDYVVSHDLVYQALLETFVRFASDRLSLYGREELLNHPEFKNDSNKLMNVLKLLNDSSLFKEVENETRMSEDPLLKIGDEVEINPDVGLVSTKINLGNGETSICLVGPKRMDYDNAISALEYLQEALNEYFKNRGGNNSDA
ncbi:MAG: heat-inducible transcription repressor HrcA [Erysipelotrichaceae bacterium]|jgi:heat-inducible transcriptional repressor|nr:heat-inducible transcription repressor HrcA [Erysipelotrichaceae bacterium]